LTSGFCAHSTSILELLVNWIETLSSPSAFGAPNSVVAGAVIGALVLAGAAAVKYGQDQLRGVLPRSERRNIRSEAKAQRNALNGDRVAAGTSAGGQFATRTRADSNVTL
jgi:hypothetical protein